jgi:hypothetical protein
MNTTYGRPFALFKRFGYKQVDFVRREVWGEMKRGNPMPFVRLAAGGYLGGKFVRKSKDLLDRLIGGKSYQKKDEPLLQDIADTFAAAGGIGLASDLFMIGNKSKSVAGSILRNIVNIATPVAISEGVKAGESAVTVATSKNKLGQLMKEVAKQTPLTRKLVHPNQQGGGGLGTGLGGSL